ncbi:MAG: hypothetical protein HWD60_19385 [Defluviicoccus sp.]|nr:MAG: hypothetical protein HWD60_19385 [Defluviicoccus sp.]
MFGGNGADTLNGGDDDDLIYGNGGDDSLAGGTGADVFRYIGSQIGNGATEGDVITDYSKTEGDVVQLGAGVSVASSSEVNGNLVVVLSGDDHDSIEFVHIQSIDDIVFIG